MRVCIVHPDLRLGGAERLIVDAAVELRARGHEVELFTAFHDPKRCFAETLDGAWESRLLLLLLLLATQA